MKFVIRRVTSQPAPSGHSFLAVGQGRWGPGNKQGERSIIIAVSVKPELRELLQVAAADQYRSLGAQAAKYIVDGLLRDGYITASKTKEMP